MKGHLRTFGELLRAGEGDKVHVRIGRAALCGRQHLCTWYILGMAGAASHTMAWAASCTWAGLDRIRWEGRIWSCILHTPAIGDVVHAGIWAYIKENKEQ